MSVMAVMGKRVVSLVSVSALVLSGLFVAAVVAPAAVAAPAPQAQRPASEVTGDVLPTVQIDGVVWSQAIVGDVVYAGGQFTNARPAGAAPGTNLTPRSNILAYSLSTGALITSFAPVLNGAVRTVTASPDGSRIYIGGLFTTADGQARFRIAAYSTATGQLVTAFHPTLSYVAKTIVATNTTVYVGGSFTNASGVARTNFAAFNASNGALTTWAPTSDNTIDTMVMAPDGSKIIAGGSFKNVNGSPSYGLAALSTVDGSLVPWAAGSVVQNAGPNAGWTSLTTDGTSIFGTGWVFGVGGNLEGTFSANPTTGTINWLEDCHGDTYSAYSDGTTVYTVSHAHYCVPVGGFPQTDPFSGNQRHALAFTTATTGTLGHNIYGGNYKDWQGFPSPTLTSWMPDPAFGNFTTQGQAAWNVTGNGQYVVMGGEFPSVSQVAQQGLARFAVKTIAPNKERPRNSGPNFIPSLAGTASGAVRVSIPSNWDRDDIALTYNVYRNNGPTPVYTTSANSVFWEVRNMGFIDSTVTPGVTYQYKVTATDPDGNVATGSNVSIVAPAVSAPNSYLAKVSSDGASPFWRLDEASGATAVDSNGLIDGTVGAGVTRGTPGAITTDTDTASTFVGTATGTGTVITQTAVPAPNTFSLEAWFKTTTTSGGKIIGFGLNNTGNSTSYDRHVYMDNSGKVYFGVNNGAARTLVSPNSYNNGQWHQVVATLGPGGMSLYLDNVLVGSRADTIAGQAYNGYWRVGGDSLGSWPGVHTSNYFAGAIDDVAIYNKVLSRASVDAHWVASGRTGTLPVNQSPVAAFTSSVSGLTASLDGSGSSDPDGTVASYSWDFGDGSAAGSGVKPSHIYAAGGTYQVKLTVTDNADGSGTVTHAVVVAGPNQPPVAAFTSSTSGLAASLDGSGSSDPDGTVASYSWDFGDGSAAGSGVKPSHVYAVDGSYQVTLTVTDNAGSSGTVAHAVVVAAANQSPVAAFTSSVSGLTASLDGSGSSDPDGTVASYSWDFGDGSAAGSGAKPTHSYAAGGSYQVTLTVTDNQGATSAVTKPVAVSAAQGPFAADLFARTVSSGWGPADQGGSWTVAGGAANFSVAAGTAKMKIPSAGATDAATLSTVSQTGADVGVSFTSDLPATGGGLYFSTAVRRVGNTFYSSKILVGSTGKVTLNLMKTVSGTETTLKAVVATGLTYTPGMVLRVRLQALGSGTTTLNAKVWQDGQVEPSAWLATATDTTVALQSPGAVGVIGYLSGTATNAPVTWSVQNFVATAPAA